jgi:hypothetical protein
MGLILYSVLSFTKWTPFPGFAALAPCVGSALIIGAGEFGPSLVGRVLSWRPMVFIGLISYSLYLWHWPVIILHSLGLSFNLQDVLPHRCAVLFPWVRLDFLTEILASFVLAVLSWRFIERPFRSRPLRISRRPLFALSAATIVLLMSLSAMVIFSGGFPGRFSSHSVRVASYLGNQGERALGPTGGCFHTDTNNSSVSENDPCLRPVEGKRNYLLIGDSLAGALWSGLSSSLPGDHVLMASMSNCKPFAHPAGSPNCRRETSYIFQTYLLKHRVDELLLEARWKPQDMSELTETIRWAQQHQIPVVVFGPVAEYDAPLPRLLAYSIAWNKPDLTSRHRVNSRAPMDAEMQRLASTTWHVPYISLYQAMCDKGDCVEYADAAHEVPIMNDEDHLNEFGSAMVVRLLIDRGELR